MYLSHNRGEGGARLEVVEDVGEGPAEDALHLQDLVAGLDEMPQGGDDWETCSYSSLCTEGKKC